mmetsp:Transcript_45904/g.103672  ORF Transcript_45904/g.103672 Transcript_45904/m.103672 type:complete len:265 (-) Transcript_45904:676-1470(-)
MGDAASPSVLITSAFLGRPGAQVMGFDLEHVLEAERHAVERPVVAHHAALPLSQLDVRAALGGHLLGVHVDLHDGPAAERDAVDAPVPPEEAVLPLGVNDLLARERGANQGALVRRGVDLEHVVGVRRAAVHAPVLRHDTSEVLVFSIGPRLAARKGATDGKHLLRLHVDLQHRVRVARNSHYKVSAARCIASMPFPASGWQLPKGGAFLRGRIDFKHTVGILGNPVYTAIGAHESPVPLVAAQKRSADERASLLGNIDFKDVL